MNGFLIGWVSSCPVFFLCLWVYWVLVIIVYRQEKVRYRHCLSCFQNLNWRLTPDITHHISILRIICLMYRTCCRSEKEDKLITLRVCLCILNDNFTLLQTKSFQEVFMWPVQLTIAPQTVGTCLWTNYWSFKSPLPTSFVYQ